MAEIPSPQTPNHETRWRWLYRRAGLALFWERFWPLAWPCVAIVMGFAIIALTDVLAILPGWVRGLVQLAFAVAIGRSLRTLVQGLLIPDLKRHPPPGRAGERVKNTAR